MTFNKLKLRKEINEGMEGFKTDLFDVFMGDLLPKYNPSLDKIKSEPIKRKTDNKDIKCFKD